MEDADEEDSYGGTKAHMDESKGDGVRPIVHFTVQDVFVVDYYGERKEDPYGYVGVGEEDLFKDGRGEGGGWGGCRGVAGGSHGVGGGFWPWKEGLREEKFLVCEGCDMDGVRRSDPEYKYGDLRV